MNLKCVFVESAKKEPSGTVFLLPHHTSMFTTVFAVSIFLVLLLALLAAKAFFLQLGGRWAKIGKVTYCRAFAAIVAAELVFGITWGVLDWIPFPGMARAHLVLILLVVLPLGSMWFVIALILKTSLWRAVWAWLPTLVPQVGFFLIVLLTVKPYLIEAFVISANSMVPTLIGRHWEAPCPRCGSPAYSSVESDRFDYDSHNRPVLMICGREYRTCEVADPPRVELPGDPAPGKQADHSPAMGRHRVQDAGRYANRLLQAAGGAAGRDGGDSRRGGVDRRPEADAAGILRGVGVPCGDQGLSS